VSAAGTPLGETADVADRAETADAEVRRMLEINRQQRAYYDEHGLEINRQRQAPYDEHVLEVCYGRQGDEAGGQGPEARRQQEDSLRWNLPMRLWNAGRQALRGLESELKIRELQERLHWEWLGDLRGKRVLDLGCFSGIPLTLELAARCGEYVGIDLSQLGVERLRAKLAARGLTHARAEVADFLAPDFPYGEFDVVYAHAVLHHFRYFGAMLGVMWRRLRPGGKVVTLDPLETSWLPWLARRAYRPFQRDAAWEWPLSRRSFSQLERYFALEAVQGLLGAAKWALLLALVPGLRGWGLRAGPRLHRKDLAEANRVGPGLWKCMKVLLCLRRRDEVLPAR
jgi:SAM-dependent methyltransferase